LSWSYWPLNGTQSSGITRKYDELETFGLLTPDYQHIAAQEIVKLLQTIESPAHRRERSVSIKTALPSGHSAHSTVQL